MPNASRASPMVAKVVVDDPDVATLYRIHGRTVMRWAARLGGPGIDLDDVVQDVFMVASRRLTGASFAAEGGDWGPGADDDAGLVEGRAKVTTWLFRTTERVVRSARRKQRMRRWLSLSRDDAASGIATSRLGPGEDLERQREVRDVYRVLDRLPERERRVLILFELEALINTNLACARALFFGALAIGGCGTRTKVGELPDAGSTGGASGTDAAIVVAGSGGRIGGGGGNPGSGGLVAGTGGGGGGGSPGSGGLGGGVGGVGGAGLGGRGCGYTSTTSRGTPTPVFMELRTFLAGQHPRSVTLGDLNGDGWGDMVVVDDLGVNVLFNDTNSNFPKIVSYPASFQPPTSIALGDVDGDGDLDMAALWSGSLTISLNDGTGAFVAPVVYSVGGTSLSLADANADGRADIVIDGATALFSTVNRNIASAAINHTFPVVDSIAGNSPSDNLIGDFDGDGFADLITYGGGSQYPGLNALFSTGSGLFAPAVQLAPLVFGPLMMRDLNGDCRSDIVGYTGGAVDISILLNLGGGRFTVGVQYDFNAPPFRGSAVLAIGDLNVDGSPDLALSTYDEKRAQGGLGLMLNDGLGGFPISLNLPTGQNVNSIAVADVNRDGRLDLAAAYESGVDLLLNVTPPGATATPDAGMAPAADAAPLD